MRSRNQASEAEVKFLQRLAKKGKGAVDLDLAERVLGLIGFEVKHRDDVALDLKKQSSGSASHMLKDRGVDLDYIHAPLGDPKGWKSYFDSVEDAEASARQIEKAAHVVDEAPKRPEVGELYVKGIKVEPAESQYQRSRLYIKDIWLGDTGLTITAPNGKSVTIPTPVKSRGQPETGPLNIAALWTFLYKNGAAEAAKKRLDELPQEDIEEAGRTKAQRERIQQARRALPEIKKVFLDITEQQYRGVIKYLEAYFIAQMHRVVEMQSEGKRVQPEYEVQKIMRHVRDEDTGRYVWEPLPDYEKRAHQEAVRAADEAREDFVHKNTARISEIARRKGSIPEAEVLSRTGGGKGNYGGEIKFTFPDDSSFVLRNKTVWKRSPLGATFAQFPTTFHEVVLPSGEKMSKPSEERMLDVFAVAPSREQNRVRALADRLARGGE